MSRDLYAFSWEALNTHGAADSSGATVSAIERALGTRISPWDDAIAVVAKKIAEDLPNVKDRLVGPHSDFFSQVDRLDAEAELRISLSLPLAVIGVVLAGTGSAWWHILSALGGVLFVDGLRHDVVFRSRLVRALSDGRVETPVLEKIAKGVESYSGRRRSLYDESSPDMELF